MDENTQRRLLEVNRLFYQTFAGEFSATRQRIQPGVWEILDQIPLNGAWLDVGCGNGALASEWIKQRRTGSYVGVDFSKGLIAAATDLIAATEIPVGLSLRLVEVDITSENWSREIFTSEFDGAMAFAVLHHIPGKDKRQLLMEQIGAMIKPGGEFILSVWQFQNNPKWLARIHPWSEVGISEEDVEEGDTLLDWRFALPERTEKTGLRYVHLFTEDELKELAQAAGFSVQYQFYSDGSGGRLGLYQIWKRL